MRPLSGSVEVTFETGGIRGIYADNHVQEVTYQRNGVSGEGFHVVKFLNIPRESYDERGARAAVVLLGIVFEGDKQVAVIDPTDLSSHYRGDKFEAGLRQAVAAWEAKL